MISDPHRALQPTGADEAQERTITTENPPCPKCGWQTVRFSHFKSVVDSALGMLSILPFRCRSCGIRFHRYHRRPREG